MSVKKPVGLGLIAALVAMVAMAFAASSALATTVTPAGAQAELEAKSNQTFTPSNGTSGTTVTCTTVTGNFTVPASPNNSLANGSVTTDFTTTPAWGGCSTNIAGTTTTVATNTTNGKWSVDAEDFPDTEPINDEAKGDVIAIGVPKAGAVITVTNVPIIGTCTITVSPEEASAVIGAWKDGTAPTGVNASYGRIKEQVRFSFAPAGCSTVGGSPAVFSGETWVKNITGGATEAITF